MTTDGRVTTDQTIEAAWRRRKIALVAHDRRKWDLQEWARFNRGILARHRLYADGFRAVRGGAGQPIRRG